MLLTTSLKYGIVSGHKKRRTLNNQIMNTYFNFAESELAESERAGRKKEAEQQRQAARLHTRRHPCPVVFW
jgi:hypothetical protein